MIANIAPKKGGSAEKKYKITNKSGTIDCDIQQSSAGIAIQLTTIGVDGFDTSPIRTTSGLVVPIARGKIPTSTTHVMRAPELSTPYYFVMPAEDVTIS